MARCSRRMEWKQRIESVLVELTPAERMRSLRDLRVSDAAGRVMHSDMARLTVEQWADKIVNLRPGSTMDAAVLRALQEHRWFPESRGGENGPWSVRESTLMREAMGRMIDELGATAAAGVFGLAGARELHSLRISGSVKRLAELFHRAGVSFDVR